MDKRFNIHDWQAKQKLAELNEKEGVKHYTKDGKEWTGATHKMPNGPLMTQNPHSEDSEELFHKDELDESNLDEAMNPKRAANALFDKLAASRLIGKQNRAQAVAVLASMLANMKMDEGDLDEMSTTGTGASFKAGNSAAYATPYAFKKKKKVNEVSYGDFKRNTESSPRQKIAKGIRQVNKMIKEIEKIVSHNFRLKTELDMNSGTFLRSTNKQVHEIGARLKQLENKLREFSN